jgi:hypothetical protein
MAYDIGITLAFIGALVLWIGRIMEQEKVYRVLRSALRQADDYKPGGRDIATIPYNQLALLVGWKSDNFPQPDKVPGEPEPHPATLRAPRRKKLKRRTL